MMPHCSAELLPAALGRMGRSVLDILLEKDVRILACGSLSCLRGLYRACCQRGAQGRLIPCYITREQYAAGTWMDILFRKIREALTLDGTCGIILYISCTEVLTGCDYQSLLKHLEPEEACRVRPFFRGPLISRRERLSETAAGLAADLPPAKKDYGRAVLPVPAVDFDGIREQAAAWGIPCVLLTPGGCGACMTPVPDARCVLTRFDDLFASCPDWEALFSRALGLCSEAPIFLKTAIPSLLLPRYTEELSPEIGSFAPCSGWGSAVRGISDFLLASVQRWCRGREIGPGQVCTLGASRLLSPFQTLPAEAWTPKTGGLPERTIVVTSAGAAAAEYLWEQFGIPYTLDAGVQEWPGEGSAPVDSLGILADPVVAASLEKELRKSCPDRKIRKLMYCPVKEDRLFYSQFPECTLCSGEAELKAALDTCRALLADPCFAPWLAAHCPDCRLIPLPYPALGVYAF